MIELYNLDIDDSEIKNLTNLNPEIMDFSDEEIKRKIDILSNLDCSKRQIKNIIVSNPDYLSLIDENIFSLIKTLLNFGFANLNILFDSNPFILNKSDFEIEDYVLKKLKAGKTLEDIVNNLESRPYLFEEL